MQLSMWRLAVVAASLVVVLTPKRFRSRPNGVHTGEIKAGSATPHWIKSITQCEGPHGGVGPPWDRSIARSASPDVSGSNYSRGTPIMVDGVLYAPDAIGLVEAFDAATGMTKWVQQPVAPTLKEAAGASTRGVSYWLGEQMCRSTRSSENTCMQWMPGPAHQNRISETTAVSH